MALKKRGGLGSGMSSLFSSNEIEEKHSGGVLEVDINKITPNPKQPRNKFDDATLMELARSSAGMMSTLPPPSWTTWSARSAAWRAL